MGIIWFLLLISLTGINCETRQVMSEVKCDTTMYKCWRDIQHPDLPNANVRLEVTYLHLSGEQTQFFAKLSNLGEVSTYGNSYTREDYELTYDASTNMGNGNVDIYSTSEILSPASLKTVFYKALSNKQHITFIETCPVCLFFGSGSKLGFCMSVSITKSGIKVEKTDRNWENNLSDYIY